MPAINLTKNQKIIFFVVAAIILIMILMAVGILPGFKKKTGGTGSQAEISLEFWGIDSADAFRAVIESYQNANQNVKITYRQVSPDDYEETLIDSLASSRGPDVLMFNHFWVPKHFEKFYPMPTNLLSIDQLREKAFAAVVADDVVWQGKIYGLPLWVDTLALFYNTDLFNSAGIALAPTTWQEFQDDSKLLTDKALTGEIKKSGSALGTASNINNAADILSVLMIQAGSSITKAGGQADFNNEAGHQALAFYTSFANPASLYYSWNNNFSDSLDVFSQGKVAMIIDYSSSRDKIKNKNPYLNYAIAPLPQAAKDPNVVENYAKNYAKNYADYWVLGVSAISQYPTSAWDFILYLTGYQQTKQYLSITGKPPAGRLLIKEMLNDEKIGIFAKQALTAKSWSQKDAGENRQILLNMIESVVNGRLSIDNALSQAAEEINKTLNN
ncbi:MAG: extracellular solute-binding protein [bacterium]|nr:extracellular solute-binding protein [bacterium]